MRGRADHVVHLELRTTSLACACSFYAQLFGWRAQRIEPCGASYLSLDLGPSIEAESSSRTRGTPSGSPMSRSRYLADVTAHALVLGGSVVLEPREGHVGWRSIVATPAGGEIALWQPKR
jgi:predicted enzyme related to lactoylglutathione lyase